MDQGTIQHPTLSLSTWQTGESQLLTEKEIILLDWGTMMKCIVDLVLIQRHWSS